MIKELSYRNCYITKPSQNVIPHSVHSAVDFLFKHHITSHVVVADIYLAEVITIAAYKCQPDRDCI